MVDVGAPPVIPIQFRKYNSYEEDPKWQRKFTILWGAVLAFFVVRSLPRLLRSARRGRALNDFWGIREDWSKRYRTIASGDGNQSSVPGARSKSGRWVSILDKFWSQCWWAIPGFELNVGQVILILGYITTVITCICVNAVLVTNSNRAGFIAIAQLPVVFLFATKNSVLSLLLGPGHGYEKLNFIHKWSGRSLFFAALLHGVLWIRNHLQYNEPILGQDKETSGVAAFAVLCIIVLSSLKPVRRYFYQVFYQLHFLLFISFFITVCYHTPYAIPWIFPPLAFYGLDLLLRMLRLRIKDAALVPVNRQMTLIHIPDCTDGWRAGQHVRLRVFSSGRLFESHPLTILSAPLETSCITSYPPGITLGARVMGDWTRALNDYAQITLQELNSLEEEYRRLPSEKGKDAVHGDSQALIQAGDDVPVQVMIDGPYGGSNVDLGDYETVLLFAGGAGATFTIGLLDDIVGRCVKKGRQGGERTRRIEFAWCIRSFGSIDWFAPALMDIAKLAASSPDLSLHIAIYVTCLCNPEAVPPIPNCDVTITRPTIYHVIQDLFTPPLPVTTAVKGATTSKESTRPSTATTSSYSPPQTDNESGTPSLASKLPWIGLGGGLAVCASGPEGLTRETANAVARFQLNNAVGPVGLHTEVFGM